MNKNVAGQTFRVFAFNRNTLVPVTGDAANITATITKDGGSPAATNDVNPTEDSGGYYLFTATQAESNADTIDITPVSATTNVQVVGVPGRIFTVRPVIASAYLDLGTFVGFPTELIVGDTYNASSGEIILEIVDADGAPLYAYNDLDFVDATSVEFIGFRSGDPVSKFISGTCTYSDSGGSTVTIHITSTETLKGKPEFTYEGRVIFTWSGTSSQKTIKTTQFKFIENY